MLTDDELAAIAARADRATPGPWESDGSAARWHARDPFAERGASVLVPKSPTDYHRSYVVMGGLQDEQGGGVGVLRNEDAEFIAAAREDVPALVAEVRRLHAQRDMARAELAELRERIGRQDERRRDAVAALCEALGLLPR